MGRGGSDVAPPIPRTSSAIMDQSSERSRLGSSINLVKKNHKKPLIQTAAVMANMSEMSAFRGIVGSLLDGL